MRKTAFLELAEKRRSVRAYKPDEVPEELVQTVLEAGRLAPSACNKQPWRFLVVRSETGRRALGAAYAREWFWKAPVVIAVCILPKEAWTRSYDGQNYAMVDGTLAMDHMTLAAAELGLGTCWIGAFDPAAVREAYATALADEPFVHLLPEGVAPATRMVRGSNHMVLNVFADRVPGRAIIIAAIDNLVKGSSGQAIQNMNLMFGLPETMGLEAAPLFP